MSESDTERAVVKTYVPAYQKAAWVEHAEALDMSQSEFIRTMVQAGRRGFFEDDEETTATETTQRGDSESLEKRIQAALTTDGYCSWEELLAAITDNIEDRLEDTLAELQDENVVRYSGRNGGYTLVDK
mgnify:CR=1 FL=1